jgi:hypothetical protein
MKIPLLLLILAGRAIIEQPVFPALSMPVWPLPALILGVRQQVGDEPTFFRACQSGCRISPRF